METKKYQYIDVMRGIAILMVVTLHVSLVVNIDSRYLFLFTQMNELGVQLFFVASALTLYLSMKSRTGSKEGVIPFYIRRFFRIAPLYYVGIIFYNVLVFCGADFSGVYGGIYRFDTILSNFLFLHGLYAPGNNCVVPGGWSIGCEMLFYLLFPVIFSRVQTRTRALYFLIGSLVVNLAFQAIATTILKRPLHVENNSFLYFFILNQLPVFACGMLPYFSVTAPVEQEKKTLMPVVGSILPFALIPYLWENAGRVPLAFALIPTLAGLAFYNLGIYLKGCKLTHPLASVVAEIGRKSFSIYLFHFFFAWEVAGITSRWMQERGVSHSFVRLFLVDILTVAFTYAVAVFTSKYIEEWGVKEGKKIIGLINARKTMQVKTPL